MTVDKKELVERKFIPYQIIITIESEKEHDELEKEIRRSYDRWWEKRSEI